MNLRRELLFNWVKLKHDGQHIKQTTQPYINHLTNVAFMSALALPLGYEIGLCHDVLEDTCTTDDELRETLINLGYQDDEADGIVFCVVELTDVFTTRNFPEISKRIRKEKEAARLTSISAGAQTVKYCDLIDNVHWVLKYDQKHAAEYLHKKERLLHLMNHGDTILYQKALDEVWDALRTFPY